MSYIVLDLFNLDFVNVSCDEEGRTLFFETKKEALEEAGNVQDPLVIDLDKKIVVRG